MIDKNSPMPLYHQIKEDIIKKIKTHEFQPDEKIDGEHEFAKKYGVSQITIRKAISDLVTEGYLYRIRGKGTYVAKDRLKHKLSLLSFSEELRQRGQQNDVKIIELDSACNPRIAQIMGISPSKPIIKIKRLRLSGNIPLGIQTSYISQDHISLKDLEKLEEIKSLYAILENKGIKPYKAYEKYKAVTIHNDRTQKLLKIAKGEPAFFVERYTYDKNENLFEYAESILRGDQYVVETEIHDY